MQQLTQLSIGDVMKLRDYQEKAVQDIYNEWAQHRNVAYVLPCRGGKSAVLAHIIRHNQGGACAIAHRSELVSQLSHTLARNGVYHRIIGAGSIARECMRVQLLEYGKHFIRRASPVVVASVDTLIKMDRNDPWFKQVTLWVCDEVHHCTIKNKWGKAVGMFPNAHGLGVTATPLRGDGLGLSHDTDGVLHTLVKGPTHPELEQKGNLAPFRIFAPTSDIDLSNVNITASGDYSPDKLRKAVHKSHITGDVVKHYLKIAPGKLGMTFCVDVQSAIQQALEFRAAGVPAVMVCGETPADDRIKYQRMHQAGEIKQLVNVDLYGEGVDIPNLEVISLARPTESFSLFYQAMCRPLNPIPGKEAIIIDHVGNVARHSAAWMRYVVGGEWSLGRREKRSRTAQTDIIHTRTCPECFAVYAREIGPVCPYCKHKSEPISRNGPEFVDGDLHELSMETLMALRGKIDEVVKTPYNASPVVVASVAKINRERAEARERLRETMLAWQMKYGSDDLRRDQRLYFITFGTDVATSQTLNKKDSEILNERIKREL